jgi:hypothetical protein
MDIKEKLKQFTEQRDQAKLELEKIKILVYKYEGAVESLQILLDEDTKKEEEKKKDKK